LSSTANLPFPYVVTTVSNDNMKLIVQTRHVYQYVSYRSEGYPRLAASDLGSLPSRGPCGRYLRPCSCGTQKIARSNRTALRALKSCSKISEAVTTASSGSRANPSSGLRRTGNRNDARGVLSYFFGRGGTEPGDGVFHQKF